MRQSRGPGSTSRRQPPTPHAVPGGRGFDRRRDVSVDSGVPIRARSGGSRDRNRRSIESTASSQASRKSSNACATNRSPVATRVVTARPVTIAYNMKSPENRYHRRDSVRVHAGGPAQDVAGQARVSSVRSREMHDSSCAHGRDSGSGCSDPRCETARRTRQTVTAEQRRAVYLISVPRRELALPTSSTPGSHCSLRRPRCREGPRAERPAARPSSGARRDPGWR